MRLGIMQPYFLPYIGYFDLVYRTDRWVVFDTVQYIRHGWVNRNRILHPKKGWLYITVPTEKHSRDTPICEVRIREDGRWRDKILGQLQHYKRKAPYFQSVYDLVASCMQDNGGSLAELNVSGLVRVCSYLGIPLNHSVFSRMDLELGPIEGPGDWALRISESMAPAST